VTGVGKSTFARRLAEAADLPYTELDALHHGPNWQPRPEFGAEAAALAAGDRWITEWQYTSKLGDLLSARADAVVWLDLPRSVALPRLIRRTIRRRLRRTVLWNGNVEPPLHTFFTAPEDNILRWEMRTHRKWRERMPEFLDERPEVPVIRLATQREVDRWPAAIAGGPRA